MGTSGQLADHYVEQEAIMLATETFIGKLSRGARPGQSVQLHPEAMGRLKRRRTSRAPARSCSSSSKRSAAGYELSTAQRDFLLRLPFTGFSKAETARLKWSDIELVQRVTASPGPNT
jgi:hypothetical protein